MSYIITRTFAILVTLLFCAKTFFMSFYALNQYPRHYHLLVQKSEYAHPSTYLWIIFLTNLTAFFAGFWLFAGLCENLYTFFSPALFVIVIFLVSDLLLHCLLFFIANAFHALMIFNFFTTIAFGVGMIVVYLASENFNATNPEQVVSGRTRWSLASESSWL